MREEHEEEREVLQSIYEGDTNFSMIGDTTFQYKYIDECENKSFLVEIAWGPEYPDAAPTFNLDLFFNKHILSSVKDKILSGLKEQAEINLGMSMTFTIFEWLKEAKDEYLAEQPTEAAVNRVAEIDEDMSQMSVSDTQEGKKSKKEAMTKSQKRRLWDRQTASGERPRGYNWVDIIKHLSQTGGSKSDG